MKIGFIGLGIMGAPMAGHLLAGGHTVVSAVHNTQPSKDLVDAGLKVVDNFSKVAEETEIIIIMVPDTPQVEEVIFSETGVSAGLSAGKLVIDMSSISPIDTKIFAQKIFKACPEKHIDIGSRIDGFVAHVATYRKIAVKKRWRIVDATKSKQAVHEDIMKIFRKKIGI